MALEDTIQRGMASFIEVGNALLEIRESRLYRERGFDRFEDYCQQQFGLSRPHAYRMIGGAQVAEIVSPIGDTLTESQARELAPLLKTDPDKIPAVWAEVVEETGGKPTAKRIREAVRAIIKPPARPTAQPDVEILTPDSRPPRSRITYHDHVVQGLAALQGGISGLASLGPAALTQIAESPEEQAEWARTMRSLANTLLKCAKTIEGELS